MVALARTENPGNLGCFIYSWAPHNVRNAWNKLPYPYDRTWKNCDYLRRFASDYKIGMDVAARGLSPKMDLDSP